MQDSERETGESKSENDAMIGAEVGVTATEVEGHEPRDAGGLYKREKARQQTVLWTAGGPQPC